MTLKHHNTGVTLILLMFLLAAFVSPAQASDKQFTMDQKEVLAGKAIGESGSDPYSIACVMRNRLEGGWAPGAVHRHFYGRWIPPTAEQATKLYAILDGGGNCNKNAWYAFATNEIKPGAYQECFLFTSEGISYFSKGALKNDC